MFLCMDKPRFFSALEGYFGQTKKKSLHRVTPNEHKALVESDYVGKIIQGSKYVPEDIIGVAFATTHRGEGIQIRQLYLTQRGWNEWKDPSLAQEYQSLIENVVIKTDSLLKICERRGFKSLVERFSENPVEYVNLNGRDKQRRILVVYSCDAGKYFGNENPLESP